MDGITERLGDQRVRNRVIECLEYLADGDEGIRAMGEIEYFEAFFDRVDDDRTYDWRDSSAYTAEEIGADERRGDHRQRLAWADRPTRSGCVRSDDPSRALRRGA